MRKVNFEKDTDFVSFKCPGCGHTHRLNVGKSGNPRWSWNGSESKPTLNPSIRMQATQRITDEMASRIMAGENIEPKKIVCHSFVRDGYIQFLADCTHKLACRVVELRGIDE